MITVTLPEGYRNERAYAVHVLLYEFLGLQYTLQVQPDAQEYRLVFDKTALRINDAFFGKYVDGSYLHVGALPEQVSSVQHAALKDIVCLYGEDVFSASEHEMYCGVDLIAGTFFMLTRWEEYVGKARDRHGRFPGTASLAHRAGFLHRPIINEYVSLLKSWLLHAGVQEHAFRKRSFTFSLHCDVDTTRRYPSTFSLLRKLIGQLVRQRSLDAVKDEVAAYREYRRTGRDPYDTFDVIMDLARRAGSRATFFFLTGGDHRFDPGQVLQRPFVRTTYDHVRERGHRAGIHFSYCTAEDEQMMLEEVEMYRAETHEHSAEARQHFLRCLVPQTWRAWERCGVTTDYSLGYPEAAGFRCGVCYPFPLFDVVMRRMLHVYERPLIAMDVTFRMYKDHIPAQAVAEVRLLLDAVRKYDGEFVLLWHNSSFGPEWQGWERVLAEIIG